MTLIRRTSPFGELLSLRQAMDRLFDETFTRPLVGPRQIPVTAPTEGTATPVTAETEEPNGDTPDGPATAA